MKPAYLLLVLLFFLVLGGVVYFGVSMDTPVDNSYIDAPAKSTGAETRPNVTFTAKHQYKDGRHIIAGKADVPTPCHTLEHDVLIAESYPEHVTINFDTFTTADTCIQKISEVRFKVEFRASPEADIEATLNGERIILNLIEADPGEDLDNFELYIKG